MSRRNHGYAAAIAAVLWICLAPSVSAQGLPSSPAERQVTARAVTLWDKGCNGKPRGAWADMLKYWYDDLTNGSALPGGHGSQAWVTDGFHSDDYMIIYPNNLWTKLPIADSNFTDKDLVSWGHDHEIGMVDSSDAAMIGLHGGNGAAGNSWSARVRADEPGMGDCDSMQDEMEFGDVDMEFLHLSSCFSMDENDWQDWESSFQRVHQIDGFHGLMYIHGDQPWLERYSNFAADAFYAAMSISWITNMYRDTCYFDEDDQVWKRKDQCGVAHAVGVGASPVSDCWNRLFNERYNNVYPDPASPAYHCTTYIKGCDPSGQPALDGAVNECLQRQAYDRGFRASGPDYLVDVGRALPPIDPAILEVSPGADWPIGQTIPAIAAAVGDAEPSEEFTDGTRTVATEPDGSVVIKSDTANGLVRYISRARQFDWAASSHTAWDSGAALGMVMGMIGDLTIPAAEIDSAGDCCRVDTVAASGFPNSGPGGAGFDTTAADVERLVTVYRHISGLPVHESYVRAAVSNDGQIARAMVRWPRFELAAGLTLRPRDEVVAEIADHLATVQAGEDLDLTIDLAYSRVGSLFLPVALAQYDDGVSGEILTVPLTAGAADGDLDGTPDATDNCPAVANAGQTDGDGDGHGDVCDNCPGTANPGQEDTNRNGQGDACEIATGACTMADGSCTDVSEASCLEPGGTYGGDYVSCETAGSVQLVVETAALSWTQRPVALTFDVVRGDIGALRTGGGDFAVATGACLADDHATPSLPYATFPPAGSIWWFLVRENTAVGPGSFDTGWPDQVASRDAGMAASGAACP